MRKRNNTLSVRLSDLEKNIINQKIAESGLPQNIFIFKTVAGKPIVSIDTLTEIIVVNKTISALIEQIKKIGVNVNQLARIANATNYLPTLNRLNEISQQLEKIKVEVDNQWQYIRRLIQKLQ